MGAKNGFCKIRSETAHDASARSHRALPNGRAVAEIPRTRAAELGASFSQRGGAEEGWGNAAAAWCRLSERSILPTRGTAW